MANQSKRTHFRFFITHAHENNNFVRQLMADLERHGLDGFCDLYSIKPGDNIVQLVGIGLEECDYYVPVLTDRSLASPWCETEISAALELSLRRDRNGRPRIIPVLLENCHDKLPVFLRIRLHISFADGYEPGLARLVVAMKDAVDALPKPKSESAPVPAASPPVKPAPSISFSPPDSPPPALDWLELFERAASGAEWDLAIEIGERALRAEPHNESIRQKAAGAYHSRGLVHSHRTNHESAIRDFDRAIELDAQRAEFFLARGARYHIRGRYPQAVSDFTRAVQLAPDEAAYYFARGKCHQSQYRWFESLEDFNQAINRDPERVYQLFARGESYYALGDFSASRSDFQRAIEINPQSAHYYHYCIGLCFTRQREYAQAVAEYSRAISLRPQQVHYYIERGRNYLWLKDQTQAQEDYQRALTLDAEKADRYFDRTVRENVSLD